jgi:hypothetical protein
VTVGLSDDSISHRRDRSSQAALRLGLAEPIGRRAQVPSDIRQGQGRRVYLLIR